MRLWPRSLQGRLLAGLLAAAIVVWAGIAVATWVDVRHELDELFDSHLAQAAALLVAQQSQPHDGDLAPVDAARLHRYAPRVAFQVWHEGRLAQRSAGAPEQPMVALAAPAARALARPAHRGGERTHRPGNRGDHDHDHDDDDGDGDQDRLDDTGIGRGFHSVQIAGTAWRVFAAQGHESDVQVFVGEQLASRANILLAVLRSTALPMALALPLLALAIWWGVRQGTAPLRRLGSQLAGRDPRALAAVAMPDAPDEMQPMLAALNALFERITTMVAAERRFTADAAHELRTPIAAIRTQAQVALAETDDAARAHALRATLAGCDRATRLVEQLLTLSRLEGGAASRTGRPVGAGTARGRRAGATCGGAASGAGPGSPGALRGERQRDTAGGAAAQPAGQRAALQPRRRRSAHRRAAPGRRGAAAGGRQRPRPERRRPAAPGRALLPRAGQRPARQRSGLVDRAAHRRGAWRARRGGAVGRAGRLAGGRALGRGGLSCQSLCVFRPCPQGAPEPVGSRCKSAPWFGPW
jgi:signal transduction histidine kinase